MRADSTSGERMRERWADRKTNERMRVHGPGLARVTPEPVGHICWVSPACSITPKYQACCRRICKVSGLEGPASCPGFPTVPDPSSFRVSGTSGLSSPAAPPSQAPSLSFFLYDILTCHSTWFTCSVRAGTRQLS